MTKHEAIEDRTALQKILAKKALRIIKYYPTPKNKSTRWRRAVRVLMIVVQIAVIQNEKKIIASQAEFKQGGIAVS